MFTSGLKSDLIENLNWFAKQPMPMKKLTLTALDKSQVFRSKGPPKCTGRRGNLEPGARCEGMVKSSSYLSLRVSISFTL